MIPLALCALLSQGSISDRLRQTPVQLDLHGATVEAFAEALSGAAGVPLRVAPDVAAAPITVRVDGLSALSVLRAVLRPRGLSAVPDGDGIRIRPRAQEELVLRVYDAAGLLERVRGVIGTVQPREAGGLRHGPWEPFPHGMYPQIVPDPEIGILTYGSVLDVQPVVSHDRRFVTLTVRATHTDLIDLEDFAVPIQDFGGSIPPEELERRKKAAIEELFLALWGDDAWPPGASIGWIDSQLVLRHTAAGHRRFLALAEAFLRYPR